MRSCFSRAFSMRLNRLVNHGELNDTTDTREGGRERRERRAAGFDGLL